MTAESKLRMIEMHQQGSSQAEICRKMSIPRSTLSDIIKAKETLLSRSVPSKATKYYKLFNDLEMQVSKWVVKQAAKRNHLNGLVICHQARLVHKAMVKQHNLEATSTSEPSTSTSEPSTSTSQPSTSTSEPSQSITERSKKTEEQKFLEFKAISGWLRNFKNRAEIKRIKLHGESASADNEKAEEFSSMLKKQIKDEKWDIRQIWNCDETGLFWKKSPNTNCVPITFCKTNNHGFKIDKKRITLLFGGNAMGHKLTPLFVNQHETPRCFQKENPASFGLFWSSNKKAWVTQTLFSNWFTTHFIPEVQAYYEEEGLDFRILLLLDNAPGHRKDLGENLAGDEVLYMPPNTTSLIQPMDQGVIRAFKAGYLSLFLHRCTESEESDYQQIVKNYNIKDCVIASVAAWKKVKLSTMTNAWNNLLKVADPEAGQVELENYQDDIDTIVDLSAVVGVKDFDINREMEDAASDEENFPNSDEDEANEDCESDEDDEKSKKHLNLKNLKDIREHFEALIGIIKENDKDDARSQKTVHELRKLSFSYRSDYQK